MEKRTLDKGLPCKPELCEGLGFKPSRGFSKTGLVDDDNGISAAVAANDSLKNDLLVFIAFI